MREQSEENDVQGIDHIVIAVRDLAAASDDYARLGFTVTPGGEHTGGATHNALISFADGAYFELIAFREPDRPQEHKWWARFAKGEGTVDFALLSESVDFEGDRLKQAGIEIDGPHDGGRLRPDGQRIAWRNLGLAATGAPLPFMIEDVTTRDLRVPTGAATEHELGVTGIAGLILLVDDLDRATGSLPDASRHARGILDSDDRRGAPGTAFQVRFAMDRAGRSGSERGGSAAAHPGARRRTIRDRPGRRRGERGATPPRSDARSAHPVGGRGDAGAVGGAGRSRSR